MGRNYQIYSTALLFFLSLGAPATQASSFVSEETPDLARGSGGFTAVVATYSDFRHSAPDGLRKGEIVSMIHDGFGWSDTALVSPGEGYDFTPRVAVDSLDNNKVWVTWVTESENGFDICLAYRNSSGWSERIMMTNDSYVDLYPDIAVDPEHNIHVIWQSFRNNRFDIYHASYNQFLDEVSNIESIGSGEAEHCFMPSITMDEIGRLWVAFEGYFGSFDFEILTRYLDGTWSDFSEIGTPARADVLPYIDYGGGYVWVTWISKNIQNSYPKSRIMLALTNDGNWLKPPPSSSGPRGTVEEGQEWRERPSVLPNFDKIWVFWYERRFNSYQNTDVVLRVLDTNELAWSNKAWIRVPDQKDKDPRAVALDNEGVRLVWQSGRSLGLVDIQPGSPLLEKSSDDTDESHAFSEIFKRDTIKHNREPWKISINQNEYTILFGDFHAHTSFSDGELMPHHVLLYARDFSLLDFSTITDHDGYGTSESLQAYELKISQLIAQCLSDTLFRALVGWEWTKSTPPGTGQRNIVFSDYQSRHYDTREDISDTLEELFDLLDSGSPMDPVVIPHHLGRAFQGGFSWETNAFNAHLIPVVEIASKHGRFEYHGCIGEPEGSIPGSDVQDALALGFELGILASSDTHSARSGRQGNVGLISRGLTIEDIFEALRAKLTFGTTHEMKTAVVIWSGEHLMGSRIETVNDPDLSAFIRSDKEVASVDLVKHAVSDTTYPFLSLISINYANNLSISSSDALPIIRGLDHFSGRGGYIYRIDVTDTTFSQAQEDCLYYIRVNHSNGEQAWSTPIWFDYAGPIKGKE